MALCRLYITYRVYCTQNYYGSNCNVYCLASSNVVNGYYTCDPKTGAKICAQGELMVEIDIEASFRNNITMKNKYISH